MTTFDRAMNQVHSEDCRALELQERRHVRELRRQAQRHAWLSLFWYWLGAACGAAGVWWLR